MLIPEHQYVVCRTFSCKCQTGHDIPLLEGTKVIIDRFVGSDRILDSDDDDLEVADDLKMVIRDHNDISYTITQHDFANLKRDVEGTDVTKVFSLANNVIRYTKDGGQTIKQFAGDTESAIRKLKAAGYVDGGQMGIVL